MNKYHKEILALLEKQAKLASISKLPQNYSGSFHPSLGISIPLLRQLAKQWAKEHANISLKEFEAVLSSLYEGKTLDEKHFAGKLLEYMPHLRQQLEPKDLNTWLNFLFGWEEIDSLCQSNFSAKEMLSNWSAWEKFITIFAKDKNISKRRASLVLLVNVVMQNNDRRLTDLAFANIDTLKSEKDILITKAISWLLRDLIQNHRKAVEKYLEENINSLPKIAIRETKRKLETGKK